MGLRKPPSSRDLEDQQSSAIKRRFDVLRGRAESQFKRAGDEQSGALKRQAAARGQLGSGAITRLQQQGREALEEQKSRALSDLESQRGVELAQQAERGIGRQFAREERLGSQSFAGEQAGLQRQFASQEAKAARAFQSKEAAIQRGFSRQLFDKEMDFKREVHSDQLNQFKEQMDLAIRQFDLDEEATRFNMDMANKQWNKKDLMEMVMNMFGADPRTGKFNPISGVLGTTATAVGGPVAGGLIGGGGGRGGLF